MTPSNDFSPSLQWVMQDSVPGEMKEIREALGCSKTVASVLSRRGIKGADNARQYLSPGETELHSPLGLPDLEESVQRLAEAIETGEQIIIYSDRDVDGSTGCVLLLQTFSMLGREADYYNPGKYDGFGLQAEAVEKLAQSYDLLVSVDCGCRAFKALRRAEELGLETIVTDHHQPADELPPARWLVNPKRDDSDYPNFHLSGGAVAFKLARALVQELAPEREEEFLNFGLPLAGLSTLGDCMELTTENRALVHLGFERWDECELPSLKELGKECEVSSIRDLSWSFLPLLNAAQSGNSGGMMVQFLQLEDEKHISANIEQLKNWREERKKERLQRREHLQNCFDSQVGPEEVPIFFIETDRYVGSWPMHGLSESWGRPVIAYRKKNGCYRGGGRSAVPINFLDLYKESEELLEDYWGHPGAAGFKIKESNLSEFKSKSIEYIWDNYTAEELRPRLEINLELKLGEVHKELLADLEKLQPFGTGFPEPVFCVKGVKPLKITSFGSNKQHLKLLFKNNRNNWIEAIEWSSDANLTELRKTDSLDLAFTLEKNDWFGQGTPRMKVEAINTKNGD